MVTNTFAELDINELINLVAAHARSSVGRRLLLEVGSLPGPDQTAHLVRLTSQLSDFIAEHEPLSFSGIDDAREFLEPGAPSAEGIAELMSLYSLARRVAGLRRALGKATPELELLQTYRTRLPDLEDLVKWTGQRLGRDGKIPDSASPELGRLRARAARLRSEIIAQLESVKRAHSQATTDAPPTLRRDRYCIAVRAGAQRHLSGLVLDSSGSGATVFVEPFEVVEQNNSLVDAVARQREEVERILREVSAAFEAQREDLSAAVEVLGKIDAAQARVLFGRSCCGRTVAPVANAALSLRGARHPLLDEKLRGLRSEVLGESPDRAQRDVVPLDFEFFGTNRMLVISGPNAGGKTVVLKTVGLMVLMAHLGIPLPVEEGTSIPLIDFLWCHIGDEQSVSDDLSTFSGAMTATARLMNAADENSLVLYDELGAGTDPLEGAALGCAILEQLCRLRSLAVATTHLAAIAMTAGENPGMDNAAMEYDDERQLPTFRLRTGRPGRSRALQIAARVGLEEPMIERARELLGGSHLKLEHWLDRLEALEGKLLDERAELERERLAQGRVREDLERRIRELEERRAAVDREFNELRLRLQRKAKNQLDEALDRLDQALRQHEALGRKKRQQLRDAALDLPQASLQPPTTDDSLGPGDTVGVEGISGHGIIEQLRGGTARVAVGGKKLWVPLQQLSRHAKADPAPSTHVATQIGDSPPRELHLRGMDGESAREELEHFLDRALSTGLPLVRIVHGHGTGTLRRMVHEVCRSHPGVRSFKHPHQRFGGTGATEVELDVGD